MAASLLYRDAVGTGSLFQGAFSCWLKISGNSQGVVGAEDYTIFSGSWNSSTNNRCQFSKNSDNSLSMQVVGGGTSTEVKCAPDGTNVRLFRDPTAWYHVVMVCDLQNATDTNRIKIWVNGEQQTLTGTYPAIAGGTQLYMFDDSTDNRLIVGGKWMSSSYSEYYKGNMSEVYVLDGNTTATAATFGEYDSTSGVWKPKLGPSVGSYGTNGVYLEFTSGSSMGTDSSGSGNTFTVSGTITPSKDTPDNNYCTANPQDNQFAGATYTNANNTIETSAGNTAFTVGTLGMVGGKYYWETKIATNNSSAMLIGITGNACSGGTAFLGEGYYEYSYYSAAGNKYNNNSATSFGSSYTAGDIIQVAVDLDNFKIWWGKDNVWQDSGDPAAGTGEAYTIRNFTEFVGSGGYGPLNYGAYLPAWGDYGSQADTYNINMGQGYFGTAAAGTNKDGNGHGLFAYAPPTGFFALCTSNISTQGGN